MASCSNGSDVSATRRLFLPIERSFSFSHVILRPEHSYVSNTPRSQHYPRWTLLNKVHTCIGVYDMEQSNIYAYNIITHSTGTCARSISIHVYAPGADRLISRLVFCCLQYLNISPGNLECKRVFRRNERTLKNIFPLYMQYVSVVIW